MDPMDRTPLLLGRAPPLTLGQKTAYGVGHVLNDICAALWFSYTLLFMQLVLKIPATTSGALLLVGQYGPMYTPDDFMNSMALDFTPLSILTNSVVFLQDRWWTRWLRLL